MEIIIKKITKEGISKEMTFGNALLFDDFLGRPHGYTYSTYTHERFARSIDGTCYAIIYAGKRRIITDQQIDDYYRDNFDATYKSNWSNEVLERREDKHRRVYAYIHMYGDLNFLVVANSREKANEMVLDKIDWDDEWDDELENFDVVTYPVDGPMIDEL